jgi:hypothetical protein
MKCAICEELKECNDFFGMNICQKCVVACNDVIFAPDSPVELEMFEQCKDKTNGKCSDILARVDCKTCGVYNEDIE